MEKVKHYMSWFNVIVSIGWVVTGIRLRASGYFGSSALSVKAISDVQDEQKVQNTRLSSLESNDNDNKILLREISTNVKWLMKEK